QSAVHSEHPPEKLSRLRLLLQGVPEGREVRRLDLQLLDAANAPHAVDTMIEAARRRAGGALAVGVVDAAVARAHEQARLLEPGHRTAQVGAVDGEDQELVPLRLVRFLWVRALVADVHAGVRHHPIPRLADGVVEGHQARLVRWKARHRPQWDPVNGGFARPEEIAEERDARYHGGEGA